MFKACLFRSLLVVLLISLAEAASAERVKLALPSKSLGYLPLFVALNRGFFKDENLDVEVVLMLPDLAHNALFQGEIDYHGAADSALRLAAKGAPIKTIFFGAALPNYFLMSAPAIHSVAELKGKYIGVSRFGSATDLAARVALAKNGLDPQRDAVVIMIGLSATRNAALVSSSIAATIANPPDNVLLRQKGFNELLFLGDAIELPGNGIATVEKKLKAEREQVKRMLRALYRGLLFAREKAAETVGIVEREWRLDPAVAKESYASVVRSMSKDGAASAAGMKVHVDMIRRTEKGMGEIPLDKIVDFRIIQEIRREGVR
jgi:NitT/TauT family transport system substrate-binding protein